MTPEELELNPLTSPKQQDQNGHQDPPLIEENSESEFPEKMGTMWCLFTFGGLLFYLLDIGSDIYVATGLYLSGMTTYFICTLMFIIPSSLVTNILSLLFYWEASKNKDAPYVSVRDWVIRVIIVFLQLGPVLRYVDTYRYGCKAKEKKLDRKEKRKMFDAMTYERADVALIRLLECFLEAAPQMVLQIYIMVDLATTDGSFIAKYVSCAISLLALSYSLISQQRAMRSSQKGAKTMTWSASFVQFSSFACLVLSRVVTFGLFASHSLLVLGIIFIIHCAIMTTWIFIMKTQLSENRFIEMVFKFLFGIAYVFCFINLEDNVSRWRRSVFHLITLSENVILITVWCLAAETDCRYIVVLLVILSYIVGVILQVVYYQLFHPNKEKIQPVYCWPLTEPTEV